MGMYDHIVGVCPSCGGELYGQTKGGDCCMNTYWVSEEMYSHEAYVVNGEDLDCRKCGKTYIVRTEESRMVRVSLEELKPKNET